MTDRQWHKPLSIDSDGTVRTCLPREGAAVAFKLACGTKIGGWWRDESFWTSEKCVTGGMGWSSKRIAEWSYRPVPPTKGTEHA